jgi:hypothetical protein
VRPTPAQLRALKRLVSPDYAVNGVVSDPRWAGISRATRWALVRRGWAQEAHGPGALRITGMGRGALHRYRDLYGADEPLMDVLRVPWFAVPNDLIGGWCVCDRPSPPSAGGIEIADFVSEETAGHIAFLHNLWLAEAKRYTAEVQDLLKLLETVDSEITPEAVAQRFRELLARLDGDP